MNASVIAAAEAVGRKRAEIGEMFRQAKAATDPSERDSLANSIKSANSDLERLIDREIAAKAAAANRQPVGRQINPADENPRTDDRDGRIIALKSADRFADHIGAVDPSEDVGLARWLRAYISGDWDGMPQAVKAMSVSATGAVVPTPTSARVIDFARNAGRVFQAGALTIPMTSSTLKVPRLLGLPDAEWKAENAALSAESELELDTVTFTARTLMAIVTMSVELAEDSEPAADAIVERALADALALELDRAALYGDANPASEPTGVYSTTGVQHVDSSAGQPANYRDFIEAVRHIRTNNFEPNAVIWSPNAAAVYDGLTDTTGQPLRPPASFADLTKLTTNQASGDDAFVGDWSRGLGIGLRTNLVIEASRDAASETGNAFSKLQVKIRAYLRGDVQVLQPGALAVITEIAGS